MRYFEMFTGIAGFSVGIEKAYESISSAKGGARMPECIGFSEIGKTPSAILRYKYPNVKNYGDANHIVCDELPDFDFLCGGFPCQSFSIAGNRQGFNEARGTLFFEIARILSHKRPRHLLLENVKGLLSSDGGKVYTTILRILADLDYRVEAVVLNSKDYGVPQNRERVFLVGHLGDECTGEVLSFGEGDAEFDEIQRTAGSERERLSVSTESLRRADGGVACRWKDERRHSDSPTIILGRDSDMDLISVGTLRTYKDGKGFREMQSNIAPTLNARERQDGVICLNNERAGNRIYDSSGFTDNVACLGANDYKEPKGVMLADRRIRRLTPVECMRLQGFEDDWCDYGISEKGDVYAISDTGKYQCAGNAVTTNVIEAIARQMIAVGCFDTGKEG